MREEPIPVVGRDRVHLGVLQSSQIGRDSGGLHHQVVHLSGHEEEHAKGIMSDSRGISLLVVDAGDGRVASCYASSVATKASARRRATAAPASTPASELSLCSPSPEKICLSAPAVRPS